MIENVSKFLTMKTVFAKTVDPVEGPFSCQGLTDRMVLLPAIPVLFEGRSTVYH